MPTPEIIALADEIQAHLERGTLIGLGPVDLGRDGTWADAEAAALLVLADVEHRAEVELGLAGARPAPRWDDLAEQLRSLQRAVARHLAVREARLRDLSEQAPAILWSTDAVLRAAAVTGAGLAGLGQGPVRGRSAALAALLGTRDAGSSALAAHVRALRGEAGVYECAWAGRVYRVHVGPLRGADGAVTGAVGAALDVTEAKQAEEVLREAERRFRLALRNTPVIVYSQDAELRHTWVYNPQHGFSAAEVIGKTDAEFVAPEEAAAQAVIKRRVLATGVGERHEVRVTVGGEVGYYDLTVEPVRGPAGDVIGITGAATNITPLKQAQAALARREAQLAEAERLAHLGSWEWDPAEGRLSWSDEHYRIFGLDARAGSPTLAEVQERIHPDDLAGARAIWEACLRTGEPYACDMRIVRPDGEVRVIHSRGAFSREGSGRPGRIVGTAQDVTEARRAEEERAIQRERQARLDGMLFAARELASHANSNLAASSGAIDALQPEAALAPHLRAAIEAAAAGLSEAMGAIAELERLIPAPPERPGSAAREGDRSPPER